MGQRKLKLRLSSNYMKEVVVSSLQKIEFYNIENISGKVFCLYTVFYDPKTNIKLLSAEKVRLSSERGVIKEGRNYAFFFVWGPETVRFSISWLEPNRPVLPLDPLPRKTEK